jgi:dTMP kinase
MNLFITFEGGEGSGKSTQARLLADRFRQQGQTFKLLREPGGTKLGEYLRSWLRDARKPLTHEAELLLFTAARAELVRKVIAPTLGQGITVILDRYADSTTAYQGYGRQLPKGKVRAVNDLATGGLTPDLTILLDGPSEITLLRARSRNRTPSIKLERFEDTDLAFHRRVRAGFLRLARKSKNRWLVIDALSPIPQIENMIWDRICQIAQIQEPGLDEAHWVV